MGSANRRRGLLGSGIWPSGRSAGDWTSGRRSGRLDRYDRSGAGRDREAGADRARRPLVSLPETIVVAWKPAPEAARAVTAAMPLLSKSKQVLMVTVAEEEGLSDEEG